jgi:hypothetical protein
VKWVRRSHGDWRSAPPQVLARRRRLNDQGDPGKDEGRVLDSAPPGLSAALAAWPRTHMVILTTHYGEPHSVKGPGNWMAATIAQAGLPDRCREPRLAQGSCQASGRSRTHRAPDHQHYVTPKMKEVERYTKAVETPGGGRERATGTGREQNCSNPNPKGGTNADFFNLCKGTLAG